jgi:hypothetical protein
MTVSVTIQKISSSGIRYRLGGHPGEGYRAFLRLTKRLLLRPASELCMYLGCWGGLCREAVSFDCAGGRTSLRKSGWLTIQAGFFFVYERYHVQERSRPKRFYRSKRLSAVSAVCTTLWQPAPAPIDTAAGYENEESGIPRDELFITAKLTIRIAVTRELEKPLRFRHRNTVCSTSISGLTASPPTRVHGTHSKNCPKPEK